MDIKWEERGKNPFVSNTAKSKRSEWQILTTFTNSCSLLQIFLSPVTEKTFMDQLQKSIPLLRTLPVSFAKMTLLVAYAPALSAVHSAIKGACQRPWPGSTRRGISEDSPMGQSHSAALYSIETAQLSSMTGMYVHERKKKCVNHLNKLLLMGSDKKKDII